MINNIENILDRESKLKKDAKNLILMAMGKNDLAINRNVKAMLGEKNKDVLIDQGMPYSKEYKQLMGDKVIGTYWQSEKKIAKMQDTQRQHQLLVENNKLKEAKEKYKLDLNIHPKQIQLPQSQAKAVDMAEIKKLYYISLLEQNIQSADMMADKKKSDAKLTITHVFKKKFEEKLLF